MSAREGRIEPQRDLEEMPGALVVGLVEAVHVPEAAMMRLPGVEGVRWPQDGAVALDRLDFVRDRGDDPVADLVEHEEGVVRRVIEGLRQDDPRRPGFGELDRHRETLPVPAHGAADHVIDVQHPAGLFRADAALVQGEHGTLRNDEEAAQLGQSCDDVVRERVGRSARIARLGGRVREGHHRDRGAARRSGRGFVGPDVPAPAQRPARARACARAARHASRIGASSRPSVSNI